MFFYLTILNNEIFKKKKASKKSTHALIPQTEVLKESEPINPIYRCVTYDAKKMTHGIKAWRIVCRSNNFNAPNHLYATQDEAASALKEALDEYVARTGNLPINFLGYRQDAEGRFLREALPLDQVNDRKECSQLPLASDQERPPLKERGQHNYQTRHQSQSLFFSVKMNKETEDNAYLELLEWISHEFTH